jgi:hypothetical protein
MSLLTDENIKVFTEIPNIELKKLWSKIPQNNNNNWKQSDGLNFEVFSKTLKESPLVFETRFGYIRVESFDWGEAVRVHGTFLGPSVFRYIEDFYKVAAMLEEYFKVKRIEVSIPLGSLSIQRLLLMIGFVRIGPGLTTIRNGQSAIPGDLWILQKEAWHGREN